MADREKVINHFQDAIEASGAENYWRFVRVDMIEDAIALLREQETTFVLEPDRYQHYHCEKCGYVTGIIARLHKFCPECGRKAKRDD